MKAFAIRLMTLIFLISCMVFGSALADKDLTILFTSDMHSYFEPHRAMIEGQLREHGGAARLNSLVAENRNDHSLLVDAGDFAMGTLLHTGFTTDAYELRLMGRIGFDAAVFGNHEWDFGADGAAKMLESAVASSDPLPALLVPANLDLSGQLNEDQQRLAAALSGINAIRYVIHDVDGVRVAIFGLLGKDGIACAPTSGVTWKDPIESAKAVVKEIGSQADVIICVSHSGRSGDGTEGEDIELAKAVPQIDVVISGHTHSTYHEQTVQGTTVLGSCGAYLAFLGKMELKVDEAGKVTCEEYRLIPIDENVAADADTQQIVDGYKEKIGKDYLEGYDFDQVIAHSGYTFPTVGEIYLEEESAFSELIADSYLYACEKAGAPVDAAVVGTGTIRSSFLEGNVTVSDAFEVCSLGMGGDGSAGHPLVAAYISGDELKLVMEIDAFVGDLSGSFKMNFAGVGNTIDKNRLPLDRVTEIHLIRPDGSTEPVVGNKLYRVACNMYAMNMLGSLASRSFGILNASPKDENGKLIEGSLYQCAVKDSNGREVKEWEGFRDYLTSFEQVNGVSEIPEEYYHTLGRKQIRHGAGLELIANPGPVTLGVIIIVLLIISLIVVLILTRKARKARRMAKRASKAAKKK